MLPSLEYEQPEILEQLSKAFKVSCNAQTVSSNMHSATILALPLLAAAVALPVTTDLLGVAPNPSEVHIKSVRCAMLETVRHAHSLAGQVRRHRMSAGQRRIDHL